MVFWSTCTCNNAFLRLMSCALIYNVKWIVDLYTCIIILCIMLYDTLSSYITSHVDTGIVVNQYINNISMSILTGFEQRSYTIL